MSMKMVCDRNFIILERRGDEADPKLRFGGLWKYRGWGTIAR
jgi:hypothetical protein